MAQIARITRTGGSYLNAASRSGATRVRKVIKVKAVPRRSRDDQPDPAEALIRQYVSTGEMEQTEAHPTLSVRV